MKDAPEKALRRAIASRLRRSRRFASPKATAFAAEALRLRDSEAIRAFLNDRRVHASPAERIRLIADTLVVSTEIPCIHRNGEIFLFFRRLLSLPRGTRGVVVEAGAYKGGGTAKLSLAARQAGRRLVVFDSFRGFPHGFRDRHRTSGALIRGKKGDYRGKLDDVKRAVHRFGCLDRCRFVPGLFAETMPRFRQPVAAAFIHVDMVESTRACVKRLYPLLVPGGSIVSRDGNFAEVTRLLGDRGFWSREVGGPKPVIEGLGTARLLVITKPIGGRPRQRR